LRQLPRQGERWQARINCSGVEHAAVPASLDALGNQGIDSERNGSLAFG
jgi:hypothetical protein